MGARPAGVDRLNKQEIKDKQTRFSTSEMEMRLDKRGGGEGPTLTAKSEGAVSLSDSLTQKRDKMWTVVT